MKKIAVTTIIFFITAFGFSQVTGYLGSRLFMSVNSSLTPDYKGDYFENRYDKKFRIRTPFSADVNFVAGNGISLGTKLTLTRVSGSFYNAYYVDDNDVLYSGIANFSTRIFSAYIEGHSRHAYSVIDNYFRLGLSLASLKNSDYPFSYVAYLNSSTHSDDFPETAKAFDLNQKTSMIGLYYEFGNRIPLSNHLLLFYGISGYIFPIRNTVYTDASYAHLSNTSSNTFIRDLGKRRVANTNMFNLNFGITWAF